MTNLGSFGVGDGIGTLAMDDGKASSLALAMLQALDAGLARTAREAKVVVILGRPGVLRGGVDLKVVRRIAGLSAVSR